jgi:molybdate transport system substrate-binding protein
VADNLNVFTSVALKGVLEQLAPEFRQMSGHGLAMTYGPAPIVVKRVREGEAADVLVVTPESMPALIRDGHAVAGTERDIARSVIGVAVRAGASRPKIGTAEEFRQSLLNAKSIAYTDPSTGAASGVHFMALMEQFGIADAVRAKAKLGSGGPVAEFVASGEAEIAIQQLCEHMLVAGVDVIGPIPAELNKTTTFTAGVASRSTVPRVAAQLIELLMAPQVQRGMPAHGLEPIQHSH